MMIFSFLYIGIFILVFVIMIYSIATNSHKRIKPRDDISSKYEVEAFNLLSNNEDLNKLRSTKKTKRHIFLLISLACIFLFFIGFRNNSPAIIFLSFLGEIIFAFVLLRNKDSILFNDVVTTIIKNYNESFDYDHESGVTCATYNEARFESYDRFHSDDLITGIIRDCPFELSEVHTEDRRTDSEGRTHYSTLFFGTFIKVNLNKNFESTITIINNRIKLFNKDKYITIDNEAFEKIYDVFTDDKIKAMRLLSPDVTSKMIDVYEETGLYCEIKIIGKFLYMRLYTGQLFPFSISNPNTEAKQIGRSIAVIDTVFKVVDNFLEEIENFDV